MILPIRAQYLEESGPMRGLHSDDRMEVPAGREDEMSVSISAVGAVAYVCCTVTFVLLVCLLFFLGLTPTQRSD